MMGMMPGPSSQQVGQYGPPPTRSHSSSYRDMGSSQQGYSPALSGGGNRQQYNMNHPYEDKGNGYPQQQQYGNHQGGGQRYPQQPSQQYSGGMGGMYQRHHSNNGPMMPSGYAPNPMGGGGGVMDATMGGRISPAVVPNQQQQHPPLPFHLGAHAYRSTPVTPVGGGGNSHNGTPQLGGGGGGGSGEYRVLPSGGPDSLGMSMGHMGNGGGVTTGGPVMMTRAYSYAGSEHVSANTQAQQQQVYGGESGRYPGGYPPSPSREYSPYAGGMG